MAKKPRDWQITSPEAVATAESSIRAILREAETEQLHGLVAYLRQILDRSGSLGFASSPALDAWFATASIASAPPELTRLVQASKCWPRWTDNPEKNKKTVAPRALCGMIVALCVSPDNADRVQHAELLDTIGAAMLSTSEGPLPSEQLGDGEKLREPWLRIWALLAEAQVSLVWTERNLREAAPGVPAAVVAQGAQGAQGAPKSQPKPKPSGHSKAMENLAHDTLWRVAQGLARVIGA